MTNKFDKQAYKQALAQSEQEQRQALSDLIDDVYLAFRESGGSAEDYLSTQFFQNLLFQSVNQTYPNSREREGALKLCLIFMRKLKQHYQDRKLDPEWKGNHDKKDV